MRKRSEARAAKASAAERTPDLTKKAAPHPAMRIMCKTCDEPSLVSECSTKTDGSLECGKCGAPIGDVEEAKAAFDAVSDGNASHDAGDAEAQEEDDTPKAGMVAGYCSECGREWHFTGKLLDFAKSCGHMNATRVKDPSDAKKIAPPAGQRVPNPGDSEKLPRARLASAEHDPRGKTLAENTKASINETIAKSPTVAVTNNHVEAPRGPRVYVAWGASKFPTVPYASVEIGPFSISEELGPDDDPVEVGTDMIAKLQEIADRAFETQIEWYGKRLKELKGDD